MVKEEKRGYWKERILTVGFLNVLPKYNRKWLKMNSGYIQPDTVENEQRDTLPGMFRDMLKKPWIHTYVHWESALVFGIVGGTYWYATNYKKKENLAHRY
ncbi:hypothetical protein AgCh_031603 [Apium graveolens]